MPYEGIVSAPIPNRKEVITTPVNGTPVVPDTIPLNSIHPMRDVKAKKQWRIRMTPALTEKLVTALPLSLVNTVAVIGQLSWAHDHLAGWGLPGQILFAMALESIALCLSYFAYRAEINNDSAFRLKMGSYMLGIIVGLINYTHFANHWRPTTVAIVVGGMSSLSPVLWGVYSRRASRDILAKNGLIETHSLRLGMSRWLWHPIRSAKVMFHATWLGENRINKAIDGYEKTRR